MLGLTAQAQILHLLKDLQVRNGLTMLFISHNLSVIEEIADRVGVIGRAPARCERLMTE
jgi:ABC-type glutathione transport system ATPase component